MLTVTGEVELITASGNVKGFALIGIPLIDVTLMDDGGVEGKRSAKGTERSAWGLVTPLNEFELASSRTRPETPRPNT
jgi:hypothetical protein